MRKAQVSIEYFIVTGFIFLSALVLIIFFMHETNNLNDSINVKQAEELTNAIAATSEKVYYFGENSRMTLKANFPNNIQSAVINSDNEIVINISTSYGIVDTNKYVPFKIEGTLPNKSGLYHINIKSYGDHVKINYT